MSQIRILLTLDGKQYAAQLAQSEQATRAFAGNINRGTAASVLMQEALAGAGNQAATFRNGMMLASRGLGPLAVALGAISSARVDLQFQRIDQSLQAVTGSAGGSAQAFNFVEQESTRLGLGLIEVAQGYVGLTAATRGTVLEGANTQLMFSAVAEAAGRLNLSQSDVNGVLRAFSQIASKGTLSAEELRQQLGDRLPGAFNIAARAMGVTTEELNEMLVRGEIASTEFLPKFSEELRRTFGTDATTRIDTASASYNRLFNEMKQIGSLLGTPVNYVGGSLAEFLASGLNTIRTGPGQMADAMAQLGRFTGRGAMFARQGQDLGNEFDATPRSTDLGLGGASNPDVDEAIDGLERQLLLLRARNNVERESALIAGGYYGVVNEGARELILTNARLLDQEQVRKNAAQEQAREQEELLLIEERRNAEADDLIQGEMDRLALMKEELRLGRAMTQSEQALFELRNGGYGDLTGAQRESLRLTLEQSAAIERLGLVSGEVFVSMIEDQVSFADGMRDGLDDYLTYAANAQRQGMDLSTTFFESFEDTLVRTLNTGKFAWRDFADSVIAEINRIAVQMLVTGLIKQGVQLMAGSGFSLAASEGPWAVAAEEHTGGIVGAGSPPMRRVPASLFAGAPRFHGGGMIGADEVPILAKRGEGVFTPEQMKAMGGTSIKIDYRPTIDARGADQAALGRVLDQTRRDLAQMQRQMYEAINRRTAPI